MRVLSSANCIYAKVVLSAVQGNLQLNFNAPCPPPPQICTTPPFLKDIPKLELKIVNSIAAAETSTDDKVAALDASVATRMGVMRDDLEAAVAAAVAVVDDKVTEEQVLGEGRFQALVTDISKIKEGAQSTVIKDRVPPTHTRARARTYARRPLCTPGSAN